MKNTLYIILLLLILPFNALIGQSCPPTDPPLGEDFESAATPMPQCWAGRWNYDQGERPQVTEIDGLGRVLQLYSGTNSLSHYSLAITPEFYLGTDDFASLFVRFVASATAEGTVLELGICSDTGTYTHNFTPLQEIILDTAATEYVVSLASYGGTGRRIAFRLSRPNQQSATYVYIDNFYVERCGAWHLATSKPTTNSLQLDFTTYGNATMSLAYTAQGSSTPTTVSNITSPYTLGGLTPNTLYTLQLSSSCQLGSSASSPEVSTGTTLQRHTFEPRYCQSFDDGLFPTDWQRPLTQGSLPDVSTTQRYSGFSLRMTTATMVTLPEADLGTSAHISSLSLQAMMYTANTNAMLLVGVTEYPTLDSGYTIVDTLRCTMGEKWQLVQASLQDYAGSGKYIVLIGSSTDPNNYDIYLDNLTIATCLPSNVAITAITNNSFTLQWDEPSGYNGNGINMVFGEPGFDPLAATPSVLHSGNATIFGLVPDHDYEVAVWGNCGGESQQCVSERLSFHTPAEPIHDGYCNQFEQYAANTYPADWFSPLGTALRPYITTVNGIDTSQCLAATVASPLSSKWPTACLPMLSSGDISDINLHFWTRCTTQYGSLQVGIMTDPNDISTFQTIKTITLYEGEYREHVVSLSGYHGTGRYIAFRFCNANNTTSVIYLDNLTLASCGVRDVRLFPTTEGKVSVQWSAFGKAGQEVYIEYGEEGFTLGEGTRVRTATKPYTFDWTSTNNVDAVVWSVCDSSTCRTSRASLNYEITKGSYCNTFSDDPTGQISPLWQRPTMLQRYPMVENGVLKLAANATVMTYVVSPMLQSSGWNEATLAFNYSVPDNCELTLGVIQDPLDISTLIPLYYYTSGSGTVMLKLESIPNTHHYLVWHLAKTNADNTLVTAFIDNVSVSTCQLKSLEVLEVTQRTATLKWTGIGHLDSVWISYQSTKKANTSLAGRDLGNTFSTKDSIVFINNLVPGHYYTFHAWADCANSSGSGCGFGSGYLQTMHGEQGVPYCQNFDEYYVSGSYNEEPIPYDWRKLGGVVMVNNGHINHPSLQLTAYGSAQPAIAILPDFYIDDTCVSVQSLKIAFWTINTSTTTGAERPILEVGFIGNILDSTTFTPFDTCSLDSIDTWQPQLIDLQSYTGTKRHIAFRLRTNSTTAQVTTRIDDLCVERCMAVDYDIDSIGQTEATLTWRSLDVDSVVLEYGLSGTKIGTGTQTVLYSSPAVIRDLIPDTLYYFAIMPICPCDIKGGVAMLNDGTDGDQNYRNPYVNADPGEDNQEPHFENGLWVWLEASGHDTIVRTLPEDMVFPYCEDFEDGIPSAMRYNEEVKAVSTTSHDGSLSLRLQGNKFQNRDYVILPPAPVGTLQRLQLSLYVYTSSTAGDAAIEVGLVSNPYHLETFTPTDTLLVATSGNNWQQYITQFSHYAGTSRYIMLRPLSSSTSAYYYIDDIYAGTCGIANAKLENTQGGNTTLVWQPLGTPTTTTIEIGEQDFLQYSGNVVATNPSPHTNPGFLQQQFTDLDPNSDILLYAQCDTIDAQCQPVRLTLNPSVSAPYCQTFASYISGQCPQHWELSGAIQDATLAVGKTTKDPMGDAFSLMLPASETPATVLLPCVKDYADVPLFATLTYRLDNYSTQMLIVGYMGSSDNLFYAVDTLTATSNAWQTVSLPLADYLSSRLALRAYAASATTVPLGSIYIQRHLLPTITTTGGTQLMADGGYGPCVVECHSKTHDTAYTVVAYPSTLEGLLPDTKYTITFYDTMGNSSCFTQQTITTPAQESLPYCQWFTNTSSTGLPTPLCMGQGSSVISTSTTYRGHNTLQLTASQLDDAVYQPLTDFTTQQVNDLYLSLSLRVSYAANTALEVGVMADPTNIATYSALDTLYPTTSNSWQSFALALDAYSGTGRFITLHPLAFTPSKYDYYIADIIVDSCPAATATVQQHGATSVKITTAMQPDFYVEYLPHGDAQGTGTILHVDHSPYTVSSLAPNSAYDFYLHCSASQSSCMPATTITTSEQLSLPYCNDFSSYDEETSLPENWQRQSSNKNTALVTSESLRLYTPTGAVILPDIDIDSLQHLHLQFTLHANTTGTRLAVGIATNVQDGTFLDFTPLDTLLATTTPRACHTSLSAYRGQGRYIVLQCLDADWLYIDNLQIDSCAIPADLTVQLVGNTTAALSWTTEPYYDFYVEYGREGFVAGTASSVHPTATPTTLSLSQLTTYNFQPTCAVGSDACPARISLTTLSSPIALPYCQGFEESESLPELWQAYAYSATVSNSATARHSGLNGLQLRNPNSHTTSIVTLSEFDINNISQLMLSLWVKGSGTLTIGVMTSATDTSTFSPVAALDIPSSAAFSRLQVSLQDYAGTGRFLAISFAHGTLCFIDDVYVSNCGALDFHTAEVSASSATISWAQSGAPQLLFQAISGNDTIACSPLSPTYEITDLQPLNTYTLVFSSLCGTTTDYCNIAASDTTHIFTPSGEGNCLDATNLLSSSVRCTYGTYGNPYDTTSVLDHGYANPLSRHTVHFDTTERDPRTNHLLRTIPTGSTASVRLGNWLTGGNGAAQAEAISYNLAIYDYDLLLLRYAAVLQDPNHSTTQQPRFRIEILDSTGQPINSCVQADFVASQSLGWNIAPNDVLWKDWSTLAVDVEPYKGQNIFVRLTTYDCQEGSHYGYAYFTLQCMQKQLIASGCDQNDSNTFSAPEGFNYRWFSTDDTTTTLATTRSLSVPFSPTAHYTCQVSKLDDPDCYFYVTAYAGSRYPNADFSYTVKERDCKFYVTFHNLSTVTTDDSSQLASNSRCETALWDFGNGNTSTQYDSPVAVFDSDGTYAITLTAGIGSNHCTDTHLLLITLQHTVYHPYITGPTSRCVNATPSQLTLHDAFACFWTTIGADSAVLVSPPTTTTYTAIAIMPNGCHDTLSHTITVLDTASVALPDTTICASQLPFRWQQQLVTRIPLDNAITLRQQSTSVINGCDSTTRLTLHVIDTTRATTTAMQHCRSALPFSWGNAVIDNQYVANHTAELTTQGYLTIAQSSASLVTGCDSITTAKLYFVDSIVALLPMQTVCQSQLPFSWNNTTVHTAPLDTTLRYTTTSVLERCDSITILPLATIATQTTTLPDTFACPSALPITWHSHTITTPALDTLLTHTLTATNGCDSMLLRHFTVPQPIDITLDDTTICSHALPFYYSNFRLSAIADTTLSLTATASNSCDSLTRLHITVVDSTVTHSTVVACYSSLPYNWHDHSVISLIGDTTLRHFSPTGCHTIDYLHISVPDTATVVMPETTLCYTALPFGWNNINVDQLYLVQHATRQPDGIFLLPLYYSTTSHHGCDSTTSLTLRVIPHIYNDLRDTAICISALPYTWNDTTIRSSALHFSASHAAVSLDYTTASAAGCDSTTTLFMHIYDTSASLLPLKKLCSSQLPFDWTFGNGTITVDSTILYVDGQPINDTVLTLRQSTPSLRSGCDSIAYLPLHVAQSSQTHLYHTACNNYSWNHQLLKHTGVYKYNTLNTNRCDSTVNLHLTINRSNDTFIYDTFCITSTYSFQGQSLNQAGTYTHTLANNSGCDSLITLYLFSRTHPMLSIDTTRLCHDNLYDLSLSSNHSDLAFFISMGSDTVGIPADTTYDPFSAITTASHTIQAPQPVSPTLIVDYPSGVSCPTSQSLTLRPYTTPTAIIDCHPSVLSDDEHDLLILNKSINATYTQFYIDSIAQLPNLQQLNHHTTKSADSVRIHLIATDQLCYDTAYLPIAINRRAVYVPNSFTPGAPEPTFFRVFAINIANFQIDIYDRWGLLVYSSSDINEAWDGNHNNTPCQTAAYVYKIRYSFHANPLTYYYQTGSVLLLR